VVAAAACWCGGATTAAVNALAVAAVVFCIRILAASASLRSSCAIVFRRPAVYPCLPRERGKVCPDIAK